ncbi:MAG: PKD domain-containing protein [Flavobacteriales bacterium]|nr:PKD domain-containing protein [Flavobacteriales bacterium]
MRPLFVGFLLLAQHIATAQVQLTMSNGVGQGCLGVLHDSGGPGGSGYANNEDLVFTLCPDQPGGNIALTFTTFALDQSGSVDSWDNLTIYDGPDTEAPTLGTYAGTDLQDLVVSVTQFNTSGCITLHFVSHASGTGTFAADFMCSTPCAAPTAVALMSEATPARVCSGEELHFDGAASYAVGAQSIVSYVWHFGPGETSTGPIVDHVFGEPGSYAVSLTVVDDNGCTSMNSVDLTVQVSTLPVLQLTTSDTLACVGTPFELSATVDAVPWTSNAMDYGDGAFLPDDVGLPITFEMDVSGFQPGSTVDATDDLGSICVDMEHSFMGDLVLQLICPNGTEFMLHQQGGGGTYLGAADDLNISGEPVQAECWHYCWSPSATNGTWVNNSIQEGNNTQLAGTPSGPALIPGNYEAVGNWEDLLGCPLNGTWQFRAIDLWGGDNGYLCSWEIHFDPQLGGDALAFMPTYGPGCDSTFWSGADISMTEPGCNTVQVTPSAPGEHPFTFTAINDHGCAFDSTITVTVLDTNDPYCISLGVDEPTPAALSAYPVPVRDVLHVAHAAPFTGYELLDLHGRQLMTGGAVPAAAPLLLDMSTLPAGLYHLRVRGADAPVVLRVVKE